MTYSANPVVEATLSSITQTELERMGEVCTLIIEEALQSATLHTIKGGKVYATGFAADNADGSESNKKVRYWTGQTRTARTYATLSKDTRKSLKDIHTARAPMNLHQLHQSRLAGKAT